MKLHLAEAEERTIWCRLQGPWPLQGLWPAWDAGVLLPAAWPRGKAVLCCGQLFQLWFKPQRRCSCWSWGGDLLSLAELGLPHL